MFKINPIYFKKFFVFSLIILITGCATIFKGTRENVSFNSEPTGAKVFVNGAFIGETPIKVELKSNQTHIIEFKKEGYATRTYQLSNSLGAGYVIFDILGGLVPVIIDAATGSWYVLDQDNIYMSLEKEKK